MPSHHELLGGPGRRFLIINSSPSFAATWLVGRIGKFKARHPETDVLIDADPIDDALESGAADALIRWGAGEFPGLAATLLFKETVFPVCAPRLIAGDDPLRTPEDLARHTLLHLDWNPAPREPRFETHRPPKRRKRRAPVVVTRPTPKAEPLDGGTDLV